MFEQILVPVDGSLLAENILPHVTEMAKACNSEVTLISVMDPKSGSSTARPVDPWDWQIRRAEVESYLDDLSSRLQSSGLRVQTIESEGKAPDRVLHQSDSMDANLIMLSSHGEGGMSDWNSSSVVTKIIQEARTSVMVIRSYDSSEHGDTDALYQRILVPVDGSRRGEYSLTAAAHLARQHGAELLVAHVVKPPELPRRTPLSARDRKFIRQIVESNQAEASQYLHTLKNTLDCKVETRLLIGDSVAEALHTLAEQEGIDLVVLNAHGFGGNPRRAFGSVTINFLTYSPIALLIVQDFARDELGETRAAAYTNDPLVQHPTPTLGAKQSFWRVS